MLDGERTLKVTKVPSYGIVLIKVIANKTLISARVKDSIMYMNRTEQKILMLKILMK